MRKDMKKSSYYVWFLGAQEAKGLRGPEYILPALNTLIAREREVEPFKVTLQVSHKGLKIIQNVPKPSGGKSGSGSSGSAVKWETVKHLVPAEAVTCALQQQDVVAAILLLVNPATRCPVHVHAYRCDGVETASLLRAQLAALAERPETLRRIQELEARLRAQGLLPATAATAHAQNAHQPAHAQHPPVGARSPPLGRPPRARRPLSAGGGSDGRSSSTRESDSSGSSGQGQDRIASLYDSLAAELRAKLGSGGGAGGGVGGGGLARAPLLLPPRDYDTVHRTRGNMAALDLRRSAAAASASTAAPAKDATAAASADAAGGSSGPSSGIGSDHAPSPDRQSDPRFLDNGDSSDEDWNDQPSEDSLLVAGGWDLSLPRARRHGNTTTTTSASTPTSGLSHGHAAHDHAHHPHVQPHPHYPPPAVAASSPPRRARQRSPSPGPLSPRDRFKDAKEKFLLLEREELTRRHDAPPPASPPPPAPAPSSASLPERGGGGGGGRARLWSRASDDDLEDRYFAQPPLPQHQRYEHLDDSFDHPDASFSYHQPPAQARRAAAYRHHPQEEEVVRRYRSQSPLEERGRPRRRGDAPAGAAERMLSPRPAPRQHAPPPEDAYRPPRHHQPPPHHPHHQAASEHSYDGRHPAADIPLHRYRSPGRSHGPAPLSAAPAPTSASAPAPAPRHRDASPLGDAYSPPRGAAYDKRRSMFDVLEDERRRNSNELAREFKRRSYQDAPGMSMSQYQELADHERFPGLDRETARLNHHSAMVAAAGGGGGSAPRRGGGPPPMAGPPGGGYRHSYAEGALPLHRTNSSVSSGRVGLAAVHPY